MEMRPINSAVSCAPSEKKAGGILPDTFSEPWESPNPKKYGWRKI
jgi:hypothetical protein